MIYFLFMRYIQAEPSCAGHPQLKHVCPCPTQIVLSPLWGCFPHLQDPSSFPSAGGWDPLWSGRTWIRLLRSWHCFQSFCPLLARLFSDEVCCSPWQQAHLVCMPQSSEKGTSCSHECQNHEQLTQGLIQALVSGMGAGPCGGPFQLWKI